MASPAHSKTKGRNGENEVVAYLQTTGFPLAERRRLTGSHDRGDISGIENVVIEVKTHKTPDLVCWAREAELERDNAHALIGAVWWRTPFRIDPARHLVALPMFGLQWLFGQTWKERIYFPTVAGARGIATIADLSFDDAAAWWPPTIGSTARRIDTALYCMPAALVVTALRDELIPALNRTR